MNKKIKKKGFTLIELTLVIGILAILSAVVIVAINPARQLAQARNTQRTANVNAILNAVHQNIIDGKGTFQTSGCEGALPTTTDRMSSASSTDYDVCGCLVATYIPEMPFDSGDSSGSFTSCSSYDTGYEIVQNSTTNRITISAPSAELSETISVTR